MLNSVSILIQVCERASRVSQLPIYTFISKTCNCLNAIVIISKIFLFLLATFLHNVAHPLIIFIESFLTIFYLYNTLVHIVYQAFFMQMTIRVLIPQKHNIARKIYNKQAGAPVPAPLTISLFHSTPLQAPLPGSPAPSHPHTSRTTHHSVPQPSHGSPAPYRSHAEGFFHPRPNQH